MARSTPLACLLLTLLCATPASAQFGSIFGGNGPPRPPGNVPEGSVNQPSQPQYIPPGGLPPGPPPGRIQMQPLPPPPGATAAPPAARVAPANVSPQTPAQPPPNLPPGEGPSQGPGAKRPPAQGSAALQPGDELVVEPPPHKIPNPTAVFAGLDKVTGRIISFDVAVNETVRFGALEVTPRACYTRPPTEAPNTDGFIEVDELTLQGELRRIFTGWMFAASPGLNAVEHPIYDVWLTDCKGGKDPTAVAEAPPPAAAPAPAARPAQPRPQQPRRQTLPPLPQAPQPFWR
jgi:hypothetical protein